MLRKLYIPLCMGFALTALLTVGCASTQPAETQISDSAITTKVASKIAADPDINPFNVDVDTNEGIVTLSGAVEKEFAQQEAERLARDTKGVREVINDIEIRERTVAERVDDGWIAGKIKTKIAADPELNPFNINVDTKDGVVTLSGRVESAADAAEAEKLASATEGVRKVQNRIEIN